MTTDFETAVEQLALGFEVLSQQYKLLAQRRQDVDRQLAVVTQERDTLSALLPERLKERIFATPISAQPSPTPNRSTLEILEAQSTSSDAVARVRDAESACFKVRQPREKRGKITYPGSLRSNRKVKVSTPDMEDAGNNDCPASDGPKCPFASMGAASMPPDHPPVSTGSNAARTPQSSLSLHKTTTTRSKRQSFHDPLRPEMKVASQVSSVQSAGSGAACPIRFMADHPAEDIAKYFEDHKNELPRSHEVCIKRFQDNTQSIKQLDEKYGNLVSMIQGLGTYHKPMMPQVPKSGDEDEVIEHDRQSDAKIQAWAEHVGEENQSSKAVLGVPAHAERLVEAEEEDGGENQAETGEEREQRFDRPLKDIRVGESPSRPWGVPIPAKFLRRASGIDSFGEGSEESTSPADMDPTTGRRKSSRDVEKANAAAMATGKCPFDHTTTTEPARMKPGAFNHVPGANTDYIKKEAPLKATEVSPVQTADAAEVVNNGVMIVANSKAMDGRVFVNHGTMIVGYSAEHAQELYNKVTSQKDV